MRDYVALLRGINVGGNNIIRMVDLQACFEKMGFKDVRTYIQSGNVVFATDEPEESLEHKIEHELSKAFGYDSIVMVISGQVFERVVKEAPEKFGTNSDEFKYDVIFLKKPLEVEEAIGQFKAREGIDNVYRGTGVLYFSRLAEALSKSYLSKIVSSPVYKSLTIRNWNTTTKLLKILEERKD